jgi:hypothetical protein
VLNSYQTFEADRGVDAFVRPDGTSGFQEFRRDPEDGVWTPLNYFSTRLFQSENDAVSSARKNVAWLDAQQGQQNEALGSEEFLKTVVRGFITKASIEAVRVFSNVVAG